VPVRLQLDQRFRKRNFEVARRDTLTKVKSKDGIDLYQRFTWEIQTDLFNKALNYRDSITEVNSFEEFKSVLNDKGGLYQHIGTEQQRLKRKLRILQKLRLDVSLWIV
jgi:prolyl-tRNA synthetase